MVSVFFNWSVLKVDGAYMWDKGPSVVKQDPLDCIFGHMFGEWLQETDYDTEGQNNVRFNKFCGIVWS